MNGRRDSDSPRADNSAGVIKLLKNSIAGSKTAFEKIIDAAPMDPHEKIRLRHFAVFVGLGVATMLYFCLASFLAGNFLLGSLIFFVGSSLLFGWLLMCYLPMGQIVYRTNALLFGGLLLYMIAIGGEAGSKSLWLFTFPLIVFFLMGKREGAIWSGGILLCALVLLSMPPSVIKIYPYGVEFTIRLVVVYLLIAIISFWFEFFRDHYRQGMEEERQRLITEIAGQQRAESSLQPAKLQIAIEIPPPLKDGLGQNSSQGVPVPAGGTPILCGTNKVLVVDDELLMRDMVKMMLEKLGCTVVTAADGVEAVELYHQHREDIALVLCDLCMPGQNGWKTLAALRAIAPQLLFVLSSGQKMTWEECPTAEDKPSAFLEKPYTLSRLRTLLEQFSIIETVQSQTILESCQGQDQASLSKKPPFGHA